MKENQIFGIRSIIEAINSGKTVNKIFAQRGLRGVLFSEFEKLARKSGIAISYVPTEKLNHLTKQKNHQGVVAQISAIDYYDLETLVEQTLKEKKEPLLFLILDGVSDVRNFGAIIRTAECASVDAIIVSKSGSAPVTADTIKTSVGAVFNVPICRVNHLKDAFFYLKQLGIKLVGATEKTENIIYNVDFNQSVGIVVGSEEKGISASLMKLLDDRCKIPMYKNIQSLNVSVACAITLYEAIRQRNF